MTKEHEAMKQALEALEEINKLSVGANAVCLPAEIDTAMDSLRQAIAEAEKQEPVAWMDKDGWIGLYKQGDANIPLYTAPPQRKPLTCFDTEKLAKQCGVEWTTRIDKLCKLVIEATHKIKENP